jgi:hypothetical protein
MGCASKLCNFVSDKGKSCRCYKKKGHQFCCNHFKSSTAPIVRRDRIRNINKQPATQVETRGETQVETQVEYPSTKTYRVGNVGVKPTKRWAPYTRSQNKKVTLNIDADEYLQMQERILRLESQVDAMKQREPSPPPMTPHTILFFMFFMFAMYVFSSVNRTQLNLLISKADTLIDQILSQFIDVIQALIINAPRIFSQQVKAICLQLKLTFKHYTDSYKCLCENINFSYKTYLPQMNL